MDGTGYYFSMGFVLPFFITYNTLPGTFVYHITMIIPVGSGAGMYLRECGGGIMSLREIWASTWIANDRYCKRKK
jgi:hypothetical protein